MTNPYLRGLGYMAAPPTAIVPLQASLPQQAQQQGQSFDMSKMLSAAAPYLMALGGSGGGGIPYGMTDISQVQGAAPRMQMSPQYMFWGA